MKTTGVNDSITSQGHQTPSLLITQENHPGLEEGGSSLENPLSFIRASVSTSRSQEGSLKGPSYQDVLLEVGAAFLSRQDQVTPEPVATCQSNAGNSTCWGDSKKDSKESKSHTSVRSDPRPLGISLS